MTRQLTAGAVPSFSINVDPTVELRRQGDVAIVTALANCPAGRHVHVQVTLTQGDTVGHGVADGACTGGLARYPVTVPAEEHASFELGPAQAEANATIRTRFRVVDTQEWARSVTLELEP